MPAIRRLLSSTLLVAVLTLSFTTNSFASGDYLWGTGFTPPIQTVDFNPNTLGTAFTVGSTPVNAYSLNVWLPLSLGNPDAGTSVDCAIYSSGGTLLALSTYTIPSSSTDQWATCTLISPLALSASTNYIAAYYQPAGYFYAFSSGYFGTHSSSPNSYITATSGQFLSSGSFAFPGTSTTTSYFVDVNVDVPPTPTPTPTSTATATPTNTTAPTSTPTSAPTNTPIPVTCTNPGGTFDSAKGSQYEYLDSVNNYTNCLVDIAIATQIAIPTNTPVPTSTPTATATIVPPTATATLAATPAAVLAATGCNPYDPKSMYQDCVIHDAQVRNDAYVFWAIPLILIAIIAFGITGRGRFFKL